MFAESNDGMHAVQGTTQKKGLLDRFLELYRKGLLDYYNQPDNSDVHPDHADHGFLERYVNPTDTVLEVGCGRGNFTYDLARQARRVYAIDPVRRYVDEIESGMSAAGIRNVTLHTAGAESLDIIPGRYDRVFFGRVLSQLPGPRRTLELAKNKLSYDGSIIVMESEMCPCNEAYPNHLTIAEKACKEAGCSFEEVDKALGIPFSITIDWVKKTADGTGLKVSKSEKLGSCSLGNDFQNFIAELRPTRPVKGE